MTEIHPSLAEVIHDKDRERVRQELADLVRALQKDGMKDRSVLRALHDVMMMVCDEVPSANRQYHFLKYVRDCAQDGIDLFEMFVEKEESTHH